MVPKIEKTLCLVLFLSVIKMPCAVGKRIFGNLNYTEDELPKLFSMDDYWQCRQNSRTFCTFNVHIIPRDNNSKLAQEIRRSKENAFRYDRSQAHRMGCLPNNVTKLKNEIRQNVDRELKEFNVDIDIVDLKCDWDVKVDFWDYIFIFIQTAYCLLIFKATKYDVSKRYVKEKIAVQTKLEKVYNIFSLKKNWEKLFRKNINADYQRLKFLQGIRFYGMILMIVSHSRLSNYSNYYDNCPDVEKASTTFDYIFPFEQYYIQPFLLMSSMLLTNQILEIHKKNGKFTLNDCGVLYINRIARLFPTCVAVIIFVNMSDLVPSSPHIWYGVNSTKINCRKNWWALLFQLNSLLSVNDMCLMPTWYIGCDTVLYVTSIFILYMTLKLDVNLSKILASSFLAFCAIFAGVIYFNKLGVTYTFDIEDARNQHFTIEFNKLYFSPWANYSTCCIGIAVGAMYFQTKNKEFKLRNFHKVLWPVVIIPPALLAVYLGLGNYESQLVKALVGSIIKPIFASAVGVWILGMVHGLGGPIKRCLEWKFAENLANVTYCVYLYHFFLLFTNKAGFNYGLVHFSVWKVVLFMVVDVVGSFIIGSMLTVAIEMPWLTVQKKYLPQLKSAQKES